MNRYALSFLALLLFCSLVPFNKNGEDGSYNAVSGLAYCTNRSACIHEVGHALDRKAGWISQSPEFSKAIQMYLYVELGKDAIETLPAAMMEMTYRSRDYNEPVKMELYAFLFQQAQGNKNNMPEIFRPFYDWDEAARLLSMINREQSLYFFR